MGGFSTMIHRRSAHRCFIGEKVGFLSHYTQQGQDVRALEVGHLQVCTQEAEVEKEDDGNGSLEIREALLRN